MLVHVRGSGKRDVCAGVNAVLVHVRGSGKRDVCAGVNAVLVHVRGSGERDVTEKTRIARELLGVN
jgi:hypothetical protein